MLKQMKNTSKAIIIFILFMVQFIDVLDFMVVMPLGPDFALSLGIEESKLGWFAASYALSASFARSLIRVAILLIPLGP